LDSAEKNDLLAIIDSSSLTPRYWATFGLITLQLTAEIFDLVLVSFLVSALAPAWHLTFGQTTIILLCSGFGSIFGALGFGWVADRMGRKFAVVTGVFVCCISAGLIALIPDGAWMLFAFLRFMVGIGYGGAVAIQFNLVVEYTPTRLRTLMASAVAIPASLGVVAASLIVSSAFQTLGWRGTAALGAAPIVIAIAIAFVAPESVRWLITQGKVEKARRALALMLTRSLDSIPVPTVTPVAAKPPAFREAFANQRRFWLLVCLHLGLGTTLTGVILWGPTMLALILDITTQQAATYFIFISLCGFTGRIFFTWLPHKVGRLKTGYVVGCGGAIALAGAALLYDQALGGVSLFFVFMLIGHFFYDGGFSNLNTYGAEIYPVRLAGLGMGVSQAASGIGKILGPLVLGLLAGSSNLVTPAATEQAVVPGFLFLSACCVVLATAYAGLGIETHRKPLALA
jgi:MFS transporter, putative metabolite:H+ symporter